MKSDNTPKYIAIEGPIGVGKTSLARRVASEVRHDLCLEDPDELVASIERALKSI